MLTHLAGPYVVGIDAGGTKTRCVVLTLGGALAGSGTGPGANPNSGGDTAGALTTALQEALGDLDRTHILTGVFGIAGAGSAGRPAAVAAARQAWQAVGLRGSPAVVTDIAVAFAAGTSEPKGIVVFSGTGAGAAVINDGTIVQRADGYGWLVGDEGSAVWLGKEAVRAALAAYDGRGSPTLLTDSVPRALLGATVVAEIDADRRRPRRSRALAMAGAPSSSPGSPLAHQAAVLASGAGTPVASGTGTAVLLTESPCPPYGDCPPHGDGSCPSSGDRPYPPPGSVPYPAPGNGPAGPHGPPGRPASHGPPGHPGTHGPPGHPGSHGHPGTHGHPGSHGPRGDAAPPGHPEMPGAPPNPRLAQAIIKEVYGRPPAALGRLGPVVAAAAAAGDPVARRITEEAAQWLLRDVDAVRPALSDPCAPVVMHGSVLREGPVAEAVRTGLRDRFAAAPRCAGDGAVGAAGMALRRLGHPLPG
ncbi:BadF/BadG/BcrA/BcrD ATPase family protein [Actinomadura meridiana]|uniref:BadF/BadG/BcrA/BcrD ATPase family protein n=1 Tax=Actinomadura meridiana TaxID=559626 RepID=UPI0031E9F10B